MLALWLPAREPPGPRSAVEALLEHAGPLREVFRQARERLRPQEHECLCCAKCYPALAASTLAQAYPHLETVPICPTDIPVARPGWPPLPGEYQVLRFHAPVAICTLMDGLLANGLDERGQIVGAEGRRPLNRNVSRDAVEAFRRQVRVSELVGCADVGRILGNVADCVDSDPGLAEPFAGLVPVPRRMAHPSDRLVLDPAGSFVIFPDRAEDALVVEHYTNDGVLDHVIEGRQPSDLCATAIGLGLVTRLDHAAYLGQELARAGQALQAGMPFVQDAAPGDLPPGDPLPSPPNPT